MVARDNGAQPRWHEKSGVRAMGGGGSAAPGTRLPVRGFALLEGAGAVSAAQSLL